MWGGEDDDVSPKSHFKSHVFDSCPDSAVIICRARGLKALIRGLTPSCWCGMLVKNLLVLQRLADVELILWKIYFTRMRWCAPFSWESFLARTCRHGTFLARKLFGQDMLTRHHSTKMACADTVHSRMSCAEVVPFSREVFLAKTCWCGTILTRSTFGENVLTWHILIWSSSRAYFTGWHFLVFFSLIFQECIVLWYEKFSWDFHFSFYSIF